MRGARPRAHRRRAVGLVRNSLISVHNSLPSGHSVSGDRTVGYAGGPPRPKTRRHAARRTSQLHGGPRSTHAQRVATYYNARSAARRRRA